MTGAAVTLVVLSEDHGREGWSSLHRVTRIALDTIVSDLDWGRAIEITPRGEVPSEVQRICAGNRWRSRSAADVPSKGALFRYVARLLYEGRERPLFVLFHVDADRAWSVRLRDPSENVQQFQEIVRTGVRRALLERSQPSLLDVEVDRLMARLSVVVPYYSIEAWLYQSTRRASDLCRARSCAGRHVPRYEEWERDRGALDEIERLKDQAQLQGLHCLRDIDKDQLARDFPADAVFDAGKSYAAWIESLLDDREFMNALELGRFKVPSD